MCVFLVGRPLSTYDKLFFSFLCVGVSLPVKGFRRREHRLFGSRSQYRINWVHFVLFFNQAFGAFFRWGTFVLEKFRQ